MNKPKRSKQYVRRDRYPFIDLIRPADGPVESLDEVATQLRMMLLKHTHWLFLADFLAQSQILAGFLQACPRALDKPAKAWGFAFDSTYVRAAVWLLAVPQTQLPESQIAPALQAGGFTCVRGSKVRRDDPDQIGRVIFYLSGNELGLDALMNALWTGEYTPGITK